MRGRRGGGGVYRVVGLIHYMHLLSIIQARVVARCTFHIFKKYIQAKVHIVFGFWMR